MLASNMIKMTANLIQVLCSHKWWGSQLEKFQTGDDNKF